jgi:cell division protein FtsI (penicillin-binding protein 3)
MATAQHRTTQVLRARRGTIYDAAGRPLALSMVAPSVYANARRISAKQEVADRLAGVVEKDAGMIRKRLEKDKGFVWVARQVDPSATASLLAMRDAGVGIMEEAKRVWPQGRLAGHVLGFTNIDQHGLEGLELTLNGALKGQDGWRSTLRDAKGDQLIGPWTTETAPVDGYDVVVTIDSVVQQVAEDVLAWGVKQYHAKGGSITIMEPHTGRILAMATEPSYNPNEAGKAPAEHRRNRAVTDVFEPGSTFKMLTAAALLEERLVTPEEQFFCENANWPTVGRHVLHDHRPHGMLSFFDVVKLSSNIGTSKAALRLKPDQLYAWARKFGIGQKTGIDVPGEVSGIFNPPSKWSKLSPYIIPIGHEVAVTPIQLAVMASVIANGGLRVQPYIVDHIRAADGRVVRTTQTASPVRVLSRETADLLQKMLSSVVESGTGQLANVQGLTVAGKTGTAQKLEPTGRYSHSRFVASFVGFGPVPDSRFVMVVAIDEPRPLYFGGVVAAPMFKRVVEKLVGYWELPRQVAQLP